MDMKRHEFRMVPEMGVTLFLRRDGQMVGPFGPTELPGNYPTLASLEWGTRLVWRYTQKADPSTSLRSGRDDDLQDC
jgi:hypothetical protein